MSDQPAPLSAVKYVFLLFFPALTLLDFSPFLRNTSVQEACSVEKTNIGSSNPGLSREYNTVIGEIQIKIEHEHRLVALKFTAAGAIIGFIFNFLNSITKQENHNSEHWSMISLGAAVCSWAAVAICAIIDIRIQENSHIM